VVLVFLSEDFGLGFFDGFSACLDHSMHDIHVSYAFSLTLALELFWYVELVFACARLYRCLLDHCWLYCLESVEY